MHILLTVKTRRFTLSTILVAFAFAMSATALAQTTQISLNADACSITLNDSKPVTINTENGNVEAITNDPDFCDNLGTTAQVTVEDFFVPQEVDQGSSFTVDLASLGARECRRTGLEGTNWPVGWTLPPPDGELVVEIPQDLPPGPKSLAFECQNGDLQASATAEVTVLEADLFTCTELNPGWTKDNAIIAGSVKITETWKDVFGDTVEFPGGNVVRISIERNKFGALEFGLTGVQPGDRGQITSDSIQGMDIAFGEALMSISPCEGDFRIDILGTCLQQVGASSFFKWTTDAESSERCVLPTADRLYFNIAFGEKLPLADGSSRVDWRCTTDNTVDECGSQIQPQ